MGFGSKRPRCGVLHSRGTAKQHNGPRPPSDTNVFTSLRGSQGGRNTFITPSFSKQFESTTACLDPGSFVWRGCPTEFTQGLSNMFDRSKSEDCSFLEKESCFLVRFSLDATACCFSTDLSFHCSFSTFFGDASVWGIRVGYGAEASSSKVPSATDAS